MENFLLTRKFERNFTDSDFEFMRVDLKRMALFSISGFNIENFHLMHATMS